MENLEIKNGKVLSTSRNFEIALRELGVFTYGEAPINSGYAAGVCVKTEKLPFSHNEPAAVRLFNNTDKARIQHYLSKQYGFSTFGGVFNNAVIEVALTDVKNA